LSTVAKAIYICFNHKKEKKQTAAAQLSRFSINNKEKHGGN
jgi:hypothetical protein